MPARERQKLPLDDPVQVAVFDLFIMLIFVDVEGAEIQQTMVERLGDGVQGIE